MSMEKSDKGVKKFTQQEKLDILAEAKEKGVSMTLEKYDLYPGTYYYWVKKFKQEGEDGLSHSSHRNYEKEVKRLSKENDVLKQLLAEKELESRLKDEMLKKKYPELRNRT